MKKLLGTFVAIGALVTSAGVALASEYQGVASYNGTWWTIRWEAYSVPCNAIILDASVVDVKATVDGVEVSLDAQGATAASSPQLTQVYFAPSPGGTLSKVTVQGKSSLQCGGLTLLLPGHVAPVPTMSEWVFILLGGLLAGGAALTLHRRRTV